MKSWLATECEEALGDARPAPALDRGPARGAPDRGALVLLERKQPRELPPEVGCIAGGERRELAERVRVLGLEPLRHLREPGMPRDERRTARRSGLGGDHSERLREDRRHNACVRESEQADE